MLMKLNKVKLLFDPEDLHFYAYNFEKVVGIYYGVLLVLFSVHHAYLVSRLSH